MSALLGTAFARLLGRDRRAASGAAEAAWAEQRASPRRQVDGTALLEWSDASDRQQAELVHLQDRSERGVGFRTRCAIAVGTAVLLTTHDSGALKGMIRHSKRNAEGGFDHGIEVIPKERRRHDRAPIDEPAGLSIVGVSSAKVRVRIRDASEGGLHLESPVEVPPDTPVRVAQGGWARPGVVMHAGARDGAFRLGIQFVGPIEPSHDDWLTT